MKYKALLLSLLMILPIAAVAFPVNADIKGPVMWVSPDLIKKKGPCLVSSTFDIEVKLWNKKDLTQVGVYAFDFTLKWPNATYMLNASARGACPTPAPKLSESVISLVSWEFTPPWDHYYVIAHEFIESDGKVGNPNDGYDRIHLAITALDGSDALEEVQIVLAKLTFHIDCEPLWPDAYFLKFDLEGTLSEPMYKDPVSGLIVTAPITPDEIDDGWLKIYVAQPDVYLAPEYFCEYKVNMPHVVEFWLSSINKAYGFGFAVSYNASLLEADVQSLVICDAFPPPYEYLHMYILEDKPIVGFNTFVVDMYRPCEKPSVTHQPGPAATFSLKSIYTYAPPVEDAALAGVSSVAAHLIPICENSTITLESAYMLSKCGCEGDGDTVRYGYNDLSADYALKITDDFGDPLNLSIEYDWRPRLGDLNLDGAVDIADLDLLAAHYGAGGTWQWSIMKWGNLDHQNLGPFLNIVDIYDFVVLAKFFGKPYECIRDPDLTLCWPN